MNKNNIVLQNEIYYVQHILDANLSDSELKGFTVKYNEAENLVKYIQFHAEADEINNLMRTYIVKDNITHEFVGYFSLKSGMISYNETKVDDREKFETLPAIELANFATNYSYVKNHKASSGCGIIIFTEFILPIIHIVAKEIGVRLIYLFALPFDTLIERYKEYDFRRLDEESENLLHARLKPIYDDGCIFMYQEL